MKFTHTVVIHTDETAYSAILLESQASDSCLRIDLHYILILRCNRTVDIHLHGISKRRLIAEKVKIDSGLSHIINESRNVSLAGRSGLYVLRQASFIYSGSSTAYVDSKQPPGTFLITFDEIKTLRIGRQRLEMKHKQRIAICWHPQ